MLPGIGAVTVRTVLRGPGEYFLQVLAVANRYRGQGGAHAREALRMTLSVLEKHAADLGAESLYVAGRVHENNLPSLRLVRTAGFERDDSICEGLAQYQ